MAANPPAVKNPPAPAAAPVAAVPAQAAAPTPPPPPVKKKRPVLAFRYIRGMEAENYKALARLGAETPAIITLTEGVREDEYKLQPRRRPQQQVSQQQQQAPVAAPVKGPQSK